MIQSLTFLEAIEKFNPYHDELGRFSTGDASVSFSAGADRIKNNTKVAEMLSYFNSRKNNLQRGVGGTVTKAGTVTNGQHRVRLVDSSLGRAENFSTSTLKEFANTKIETPEKPGVATKWGSMTDDEFVDAIQKRMPGIDRTIDYCIKNGLVDSDGYVSSYKFQDSGKNGDMALTQICAMRGYHALPTMMTRDEIKDYMSKNGTPELYRGMGTSSHGQTGSEKQDRFANDPLNFAGYGVLGNGTYAAETPKGSYYNSGLRVARSYSGHAQDGTIRMTLQNGTKTSTFTRLEQDKRAFRQKLSDANVNGKISNKRYADLMNITEDTGRYAALRGYQAWYDKGAGSGGSKNAPYWVLLNRGSMIIQSDKRYT